MVQTYRAVVFREYGPPDVLHVEELNRLTPGPGQVLLKVNAAGVNPIDWKIRSGAMSGGRAGDFPMVPGIDVAGTVEEIGPGVTAFAVGDAVLGRAGGTYAEFCLSGVDALTPKPPSLSWELAAALPVSATTTYRVLTLLRAQAGQTIVVNGAAGGVGALAVQIALHRGLIVVGTAATANHDYLRSLGAIPVTYGAGLADRVRQVAPQGVDLGFDAAGHGALPELLELTGHPDRVVTIADPTAAQHGVRFTAGGSDEVAGSLAEVVGLVTAGVVTQQIAGTYSLEQAAQAHRDSQEGHVRGKLIITPR